MTSTRAKFRCDSVTVYSYGTDRRHYALTPVYDTSTPENERFTKATPSGKLEMVVDNPEVQLELGAFYYLDFTKVEPEIVAADA